MIRLIEVSKRFTAQGQPVAERISAEFPGNRAVALLGRNGAGKSTLLQLVGGILTPDSGRIERAGRVSWPIGIAFGFHRDMTGWDYVAFLSRLHGVPARALGAFVAEEGELGPAMHRPIRQYSAGMRARLGFAAAMALPFDFYLIDEVTAVGDGAFRRRSEAMLRARLHQAGAIVVSHSMSQVRAFCSAGAVLAAGRLTWFDDVEDAIAVHEAMMAVA